MKSKIMQDLIGSFIYDVSILLSIYKNISYDSQTHPISGGEKKLLELTIFGRVGYPH